MTSEMTIHYLAQIHDELTRILNDAYVSGVLKDDKHRIWLQGSLYGITGVLADLRKKEGEK